MDSKFDFFEIVIVHSEDKDLICLEGKRCIVLGKSQDDEDAWHYAVSCKDVDHTWIVPEADLRSTGTFTTRDKIYDGSHITVSQDGEITGGEIKEE